MPSATGNDAGPSGQQVPFGDQVIRLERWMKAHKDALYIPPDSNFRVRWGGVEFKALSLDLLMDKLEQLGEPSSEGSASDG